jgi:hypothetical protein
MASRIVTAHQKHTESIQQALTTHGPAIVSGVRFVTGAADPEHEVDVTPLLAHAGRALADRLGALIAADDAHQLELTDDAEPRTQRDAAAAELYRALVDLKQVTARLFGDGWVTKLSFPQEVSADPAQLARTGKQVIDALSTKTLPAPQVPGVGPVDGAVWITLLQGPLGRLTDARNDVTREEKEARATRTARDQALADLVAANVAAALLAQSLARIGGVLHLVEGLRGTLDTSVAAPIEDAPVDPVPPA